MNFCCSFVIMFSSDIMAMPWCYYNKEKGVFILYIKRNLAIFATIFEWENSENLVCAIIYSINRRTFQLN